jgi:hypothetical protein
MITFQQLNNQKKVLRVPLSTFAADTVNGTCAINVYNYYMGYETNVVVVGSMFFYQFYGYFTNSYDQDANPVEQTA